MAANKNSTANDDLLLRFLDCAIIESLHVTMKAQKDLFAYDSVRGVFIEGSPIYPNAGFRKKTHIQICVRNPNCIKGVFRPRHTDNSWQIP